LKEGIIMNFNDKKKYYTGLFAIGIGILILLIIISITLGSADVSVNDSFRIIASKIPIINEFVNIDDIKLSSSVIILKIRLPRIILAALVGINLSLVGAVYQGIFKNPMADPYVLGVSSGSALGAATAIVFGIQTMLLGISGVALAAFVGAIITTVSVYNIARVGNKASTINLLLAGVAVSFFLSSLISILMIFNRNEVDKIIFWTMGSLTAASWSQVIFLLFITIPLSIFIMFFSRDINIVLLGDDSAKNLGIDVEKLKKIMLLISSLLVAASVSVSGVIGFVGLIIPHSVKMLTGSDNRVLIPFSALAGGCFMIISDTLARTLLSPTEMPVGAITSLFGAPYFIYLLYKNKKKVF
jgi:iron complex transport system permease protein